MAFIFFLISLLSSTIGSISGIGGGVIIKPVLDATNTLPVATISFLSGCTVLTMSIVSLLRQRNSGVKLDAKRTTPLAIGGAIGGIIGKCIFDFTKSILSENILGGTQAAMLFIMTFGVLLFVLYKHKLKMLNINSILVAFTVGFALGLISAFLGIGGGPMNIAVLYFFFSMSPKSAALNSIYVIMFSQITSLFSSILTGSIPQFSCTVLLFMMAGGVLGALIGSAISKKVDNVKVEFCFKILLFVIMSINVYNMIEFF
ncbi:MAG: sulfite exporter TauE/SafE family protein [Oscillospiraceae bacterium]